MQTIRLNSMEYYLNANMRLSAKLNSDQVGELGFKFAW